ncbi:MAG: hypothetical protein H7X79_10540 [Sporomusaceae bacterium]|nr:hypothetical protein [Sporomusaceae bacterium]
MAPLKQAVCQHLRSAKEWLTKAEESFDKQHDIRAELDLMLAQAELQRVKEVSRSRQWRYKYTAFRHGLALSLAMCMAVAVGGVYWWTTKPEAVLPVPAERQVSLPMEVKAEVNTLPAVLPKENNPPVKQAANEIVKPLPRIEQVHQSEPSVVLSADEMQKLVRAAGKSLRGQ